MMEIGKKWYPQNDSILAQQLPFGIYAKQIHTPGPNEPNALKILEESQPSIPAPLLIDTFEHAGEEYFIMTQIPGQQLGDIFYRLSYEERDQLAVDISEIVQKMRSIPNQTEYFVSSTIGGPITDHRATSTQCGPYRAEIEFNERLIEKLGDEMKSTITSKRTYNSHKSVFTHSDFFRGNILLQNGRLSGIVDWENASFMPEYWEYTRAMWTSMRRKEVQELWTKAFGGLYQEELEVERILWRSNPFGGR
jgi:aminoglycoside phosphotransferase (APT) family kinase protein